MPLASYQQYAQKSVWVSSGDAYSSQTISGSLRQLSRIQSTNFTLDLPVQDNVYLDSSVEAYTPTTPGVSVDMRWLNTNGSNEYFVGLARLDPSGTLILGLDEEKNLYIPIEESQGIDAIGAPAGGPRMTLGLGNTAITAYEVGAQVGGLIEARATLGCLTANVYTGFSGMRSPAVNYQAGGSYTGLFTIPAPETQYNSSSLATGFASALAAREMFVMFPQNTPFGVVLSGSNSCYLQSFNVALTVNRQEMRPLGYAYPTARPVIYPIRVDLSTEAIVSRYQADSLERFSCNSTGFSIQLVVKQPCTNLTMFGFYFENMQLDTQSFAQSIGPLDTVNLKWHGWIKTPNDLFFDPNYNYLVRTDTTGSWGTQW